MSPGIAQGAGASECNLPMVAGVDCEFYDDVWAPCRLDLEATIQRVYRPLRS